MNNDIYFLSDRHLTVLAILCVYILQWDLCLEISFSVGILCQIMINYRINEVVMWRYNRHNLTTVGNSVKLFLS